MVIDRRRLAFEYGSHEAHGVMDGDRGELQPVGDIADGKNVRHAAPRIDIYLYVALLPELHAGRFEAHSIGVRSAADRQKYRVGFQNFVVIGEGEEFATALFDAPQIAVTEHAQAVAAHLGHQAIAHVLVEAAKHLAAAIDERSVAAKPVKNVREFHRDITAA